MAKKISDKGLDLIKEFEGCRLTAYKPVAAEQYWTIGWGHYGPDVYKGMTITQKQADLLLIGDMVAYEKHVNNPALCPVTDKLNQNQFDALVSFTYNCGQGSLQQLCRNRTIAQIPEHMTAYVNGASGRLEGLVRRRKAEVALYNTPVVPVKKEEEPMEKRYQTVAECPDYAKEAIGFLVDHKVIADGNRLNMTEDMLRLLTFMFRLHKL